MDHETVVKLKAIFDKHYRELGNIPGVTHVFIGPGYIGVLLKSYDTETLFHLPKYVENIPVRAVQLPPGEGISAWLAKNS